MRSASMFAGEEKGLSFETYLKIHETISRADSLANIGIIPFTDSRGYIHDSNLHKLYAMSGLFVTEQEAGRGLPGDMTVSQAFQQLVQPEALTGILTGGESYRRGNEDLLRAAPWQSLFSGMNSLWWAKGWNGVEAALTPSFAPSPAFSIVAEEVSTIRSGIDMLLSGSSRHTDAIGIFYSIHSDIPEGNKASDTLDNTILSIRSFYNLCRDTGYSPVFISDKQLADYQRNGALPSGSELTVLFLPDAQAMSDETAENITSFVQNGGTVIADMRPAVMNEHFVIRESGGLDAMLGITQDMERTSPGETGAFISKDNIEELPSGLKIHDIRFDSSVRIHEDARVLASVEKNPAVIVNQYGDGQGIFLNMGMEQYENIRTKNAGRVFRTVISRCFRIGGIEEPYIRFLNTTGDYSPVVNINVFHDSDNIYIGVLPDPLSKAVKSKTGSGNLPDKGTIKINTGEHPYVYDVLNKTFLGITTDISVSLSPGKALLFSLLPYRIREVKLAFKKNVITAGDWPEYTVSVIPHNNTTTPGRHVVQLRVTGPDGEERSYLTGTYDVIDGRLEGTLPIASNEPHGRWSMHVRDIASGKQVERFFMVMAVERLR
ncbi:MAG: hypothetical protein HOC71_14030 [Candidatus Latescibacteria bacterium]|nr:hypothetical protein [Candidatus Latescibacterota bacterium]